MLKQNASLISSMSEKRRQHRCSSAV